MFPKFRAATSLLVCDVIGLLEPVCPIMVMAILGASSGVPSAISPESPRKNKQVANENLEVLIPNFH